MFNYFIIFFLILSFLLIYISKKYNLFLDFKLEKHKRFSTNLKSYSIGGILLIAFFIYSFVLYQKEYLLFLFLFSTFLLGLFSDLKKLNSANLRFFLQIILIIFFISFLDLKINYTRVDLFDFILKENILANVIFTTFCLLILVNGGNFVDGLNGLILKYNIIIYAILFFGLSNHFFYLEKEFLQNLIVVLSILLILNLSGFLYMGDSGAYLLSLFTGIYLINFSNDNFIISPYFIVLLLWYPCFELLFSIIRRSLKARKTYKSDNFHLHQLIYSFLKIKLNFKNNLMVHFLTSSIINLYSLVIFLVALNNKFDSKFIIYLIIFNLVIYTSFYKIFYKFYKLKN
tara:strand:- start:3957 stop:4988 length:1032 start_codon:yes stop_codon:yes gene_type:complete